MVDVYKLRKDGYTIKLESNIIRFSHYEHGRPIRERYEVVYCDTCGNKCYGIRDAIGWCHVAKCNVCLFEFVITYHRLTSRNRFVSMNNEILHDLNNE